MNFSAKALYIKFSPFKLRPLVDVMRGKTAQAALWWLHTYKTRRAVPILKLLNSAIANAKSLQNISAEELVIKDIRVDHGPTYKYFKPGAQGRANVQKKRSSHIQIQLVALTKEV
ncbi:50S ribosomal protein L22 [bacterium]|nr:MAG: 50S ribosomal protein L22 [bacterium]QQR62040.1 MAG: 50S ribosomal protein L22 [bacterium]QQR62365.1 MAG: 50S ribosomal protein L22 [bacterium]